MRNSVPLPISLSKPMSPPIAVMMRCEIARPRPVPTPIGLVVKNGVNRRCLVSADMPAPVSRIVMFTCEGVAVVETLISLPS